MNKLERQIERSHSKKRAPKGAQLRRIGRYRVEVRDEVTGKRLFVWRIWRKGLLAECYFRVHSHDYHDAVSGDWFDVVTLSNIWVITRMKRRGIGTMIVREIASRNPNAMFQGENPSDEARLWHEKCLERIFPTRMLSVASRWQSRTMPGKAIDPAELA